MSHCSFNNTGVELMQDGPISGDISIALSALSELVYLLPDENIREARKLLNNLFGCAERVKELESMAIIISQTEEEACHV